MIQEGRKAPAFSLESSDGGKVALKDLAGKYAIIYFYPRDNTPGCTTEANDFNKALRKIKARDAVVIGVSKDSIASHCKFADKYELKFPLLSDPDGEMLEKYDAWGEKNMYGKKSMGIIRSTVLIGPDGKVIKHFPKVKVNGHVDEVLEALDDARSN
ncbi:MAG: peroxiredoxin [Myxococcales bacterium]|nr:peroxiredoxin [Myxococcales bacterium]MDH3484507.1 peroxiredoxin [Myxococcales bacterium]